MTVDGRTARRDRNSEAVLDTVHQMFVEGNFSPAVDEVAARSGVSLRSVYRYFEDTEALLRMAIQRRVSLVEGMFVLPGIGVGTLQQRIEGVVNHRLVLHAKLGPTVRAAVLRAPYSPLLAEQVQRRRQLLSEQMAEHFAPELATMTKTKAEEVLACADALCEFEAMEHLRARRGMSVARTRKAMITGLTALLGGATHG
ncbi:MAG: putative TetR family transcriptional regulator [Frankiales bacterium]|nr:putative TetR family transcriptional regulator [Frankiales bacterium]